MDSVEVPCACSSLRCAAKVIAAAAAPISPSQPSISARRCEASAGLAPAGADRNGHRAIARHRRQDERAVGRVVGRVHPDASRTGVGGHGGVDRRVIGRGDDQTNPIEIAGFVGAIDDPDRQRADRIDSIGGHHRDRGTGLDQAFDLADGHPSPSDHEDRHTGQIKHDGVVERHRERLPTINCLKVDRISRN